MALFTTSLALFPPLPATRRTPLEGVKGHARERTGKWKSGVDRRD